MRVTFDEADPRYRHPSKSSWERKRCESRRRRSTCSLSWSRAARERWRKQTSIERAMAWNLNRSQRPVSATLIREIRGGLGDSARHPRFIRTVHRFGYAFCASVPDAPGQSVSRTGLGYWLTWEARQIPLHSGENILGREPDAAVWLDSATVSRQHARIHDFKSIVPLSRTLAARTAPTCGGPGSQASSAW